MKTRQLLPLVLVLGLVGCTRLTPVQLAQVSHDYLALAQDIEAQACWGVPSVAAALAANVPATHCTTSFAASIGLTDARHQAFNAAMARALVLHMTLTTQVTSATISTATAAFKTAVADVVAAVQMLVTNPLVQTLLHYLQQAVA